MKEARQPDIHAPRYRLRAKEILNHNYAERVRAELPRFKHATDQEIFAIISTFNKKVVENIIYFRDGVELPQSLGYIFGASCLPKVRKNVDFKTSADYLKVIQHRNFESDRFLAKIFYTNYETKYSFKYHELWSFQACRRFTRSFSEEYTRSWKRYIQIDHTLKISRLFRKQNFKLKKTKEDEISLQEYDEFT